MMKNIARISISFKLISITSLLLVVSLMTSSYLATRFFEKDTVTRIQEVTADKSRLLSFKIESDIRYLLERSNAIAKFLLVKKQQQRTSTNSLYQLSTIEVDNFQNSKGLLYLAVYQAHEKTAPKLEDDWVNEKNSTQVKYFYQNISDSTDILAEDVSSASIYNVSLVAESPVLGLHFPLKSIDKKQYFAVAYFKQSFFAEVIETVSEYTTYIINHNGVVLAHPNSKYVDEAVNFSENILVDTMLRSPINNGQMSYLDDSGIKKIGSFFKTERCSLGIFSSAEENKILAAVFLIRKRQYIITIIVLLISVLVVYVFAKTLSTPIRRLLAAMKEVEKGHFLVKIQASTSDEIGTLTDSFTKMSKGLEERQKIKDALGRFVNEEIANLAMKGELRLGGEKKTAVVFFSDIRSFTALSEKLSPEEVVEFLNEYMTAMVACVEQTYGVIDKFIGDAVMAIWGAPISHENDTENAINSALLMRAALEQLNQRRLSQGKSEIRIGCGLNTGPLIVGQIGSEHRMEYTVIGDTVNLASRIESLTKAFGVDILISEFSYRQVEGIYHLELMPAVRVKGKAEPVLVYAVLGRKDNPNSIRSVSTLRESLGIENINLSQFKKSDFKDAKYSHINANNK